MLGLVFNSDPYVVTDLDNCIVNNEDPTFLESVLTLIAIFKRSYLEISGRDILFIEANSNINRTKVDNF